MSHGTRRSQLHRCSDGLEGLLCSQPQFFGDGCEPLRRVRHSKAQGSGARRPLARRCFPSGSSRAGRWSCHSSLQSRVSSEMETMIWSEPSPWLGGQTHLSQCEYKYFACYEGPCKCERSLLIWYKQKAIGKREVHGDGGATGVFKNTCNVDAQLH